MILAPALLFVALLIIIVGLRRLPAAPATRGFAAPLVIWFCLFFGGVAIWTMFARS